MTAWTTLAEKLSTAVGARADRTTWRGPLAMAVGFDLAQHARNRLALALVVFFIPAWIGLVRAVLPDRPVVYHSEVAGRALSVRADELITISGAINAVTLIVGFMMFTAVRRSGDFDQRLVLAGYPKSALLVAKLVGLLLISGVVAAYATVVLTLHWDPERVWLIGFGLATSGLVYGGLGVVLGFALSTELSGMFVIIMVPGRGDGAEPGHQPVVGPERRALRAHLRRHADGHDGGLHRPGVVGLRAAVPAVDGRVRRGRGGHVPPPHQGPHVP